jgi:hypothetical protein
MLGIGSSDTQWEPVLEVLSECGRHSLARAVTFIDHVTVGNRPQLANFNLSRASEFGCEDQRLSRRSAGCHLDFHKGPSEILVIHG